VSRLDINKAKRNCEPEVISVPLRKAMTRMMIRLLDRRMMSLTTTTVLGKRKKGVTSETLLLQLSTSESNHENSDATWQDPESDAEFTRTPSTPKQKSGLVLVNGSLVKNAKKKYFCTFTGCGKSYSKPCRLEEHERSHTGEVNFSF
jgi:hypothetical protein